MTSTNQNSITKLASKSNLKCKKLYKITKFTFFIAANLQNSSPTNFIAYENQYPCKGVKQSVKLTDYKF